EDIAPSPWRMRQRGFAAAHRALGPATAGEQRPDTPDGTAPAVSPSGLLERRGCPGEPSRLPVHGRGERGVGQASGPGGGLCIPGPSTRKKSRRRQAAAKEDLRKEGEEER
ncbi:unnamed protein product, partial [Prorocentrum cordatum]